MSISLNKPGSDGLCIETMSLDAEEIANAFWLDDHEECPGNSAGFNPAYYCYGTQHTISSKMKIFL